MGKHPYYAKEVRLLAEQELRQEQIKADVEAEKARLRRRQRIKRFLISLLTPWRFL